VSACVIKVYKIKNKLMSVHICYSWLCKSMHKPTVWSFTVSKP